MSSKLFNELMNDIQEDKYHLVFDDDREMFLFEVEDLWLNDRLTSDEYSKILNEVEKWIEQDDEDDF